MQVVLLANNTQIFNTEPQNTVLAFKKQIATDFKLDAADLVLTHEGVVLDDSETLDHYNIEQLSVVKVGSKLLGGKVHGSLARAGKVRNQTKKVEKEEKKKPKTGRAKRRMLYTRRFCNVKPTRGRRVGPNSNKK